MRLDELTTGQRLKVIKSFEDFDSEEIEKGSDRLSIGTTISERTTIL